MNRNTLHVGDCLDIVAEWPDDCVDLVFGSPPYEDARTYGIDFRLKGQDWVDWMAKRVRALCRVSKGLVFVVASGKVRDYRYSPVIEWLVADLTRSGIAAAPSPYVFNRVGIPGSGGPHFHRRDWEPVYGFADPAKLPPHWSDNTACGHPPKWAPGGEMSHRLSDGTRRNQWGPSAKSTGGERGKDGRLKEIKPKPSHKFSTRRCANGSLEQQDYEPPTLANPGNVIAGVVGGGHMGHDLAHQNEACFPVWLAEFFVKSFCPPGGIVVDPFCGSGTTCETAVHHDRNYIGIDIRESQIELTRERLGLFAPQPVARAADTEVEL